MLYEAEMDNEVVTPLNLKYPKKMSYHTWHVYGYGICTDDIVRNTTEDRVKNLLSLAPVFNEKLQKHFSECGVETPELDDYKEYDEMCLNGITSILFHVIEEAEDMPLCAVRDYEDCEYIVFEPMYPWVEPDSVKDLTEEKLEQIFKKYVGILMDEAIEIGFQEIENGG